MTQLIIPVPGNHNNTILLLALAKQLDDPIDMVFFPTDMVADRILREVAQELGVNLIDMSEGRRRRPYSTIFFHGWSRNMAEIESINGYNAATKYLYGDGLSNRLMAGESAVDGFVIWASNHLHLKLADIIQPGKQIIEVNNEAIRQVWKRVVEIADIGEPKLGIESGSSLIGMRYWGSSTYLGIGLREVRAALSSAYESSSKPEVLWVKEDTRWQSPISQVDLVREVMAHDDVRPLNMPTKMRRKLGHLANLDAFAYSTDFPEISFFGFDGSLPLTLHFTQPSVHVLVPSLRFDSSFPAAKMINENLDWHGAVLTEDVTMQREILPLLIESKSLQRSIAGARPGAGLSDANLGHVARVLVRDWGSQSEATTEQLSWAIQARARQSKRRQKVIRALRDSKLVERIYFSAARFLLLRKLLVRLSRYFR